MESWKIAQTPKPRRACVIGLKSAMYLPVAESHAPNRLMLSPCVQFVPTLLHV